MLAITTGFASGLALIIAIGAQNAFVLRQGLKRQNVFAVVLFCAVADAVLIGAGILGLGSGYRICSLVIGSSALWWSCLSGVVWNQFNSKGH